MDNSATKDGWQRFLDRLKELWGKRADEQRRDSRPGRAAADDNHIDWIVQIDRHGLDL